MARGPRLFSPPFEPILWICQGNSNTNHLAQLMNGSPVSSKYPKAQASLAYAKQGKGKKKRQAAISFPRNNVTQLDSTSESSEGHDSQHATLARARKLPALLLEQTYGSMPRRVSIYQDGKARNWDIGRLGYFNPLPSMVESTRKYWKPTLDHMCGLDDDRGLTTFSKTSMTNTTTKSLALSLEQIFGPMPLRVVINKGKASNWE